MKAETIVRTITQAMLAWWSSMNACEETGSHHLDRPRLGVWFSIALHHSSWPESARRR
ncbi:MAG: hypothetical protein RLZZ555_154 [Pseudomonadota bacterium]